MAINKKNSTVKSSPVIASIKPMQTAPNTPITNKLAPIMKAPKIKKRLTSEEEFKIFTIVLDKILWLGFGIMALGLYEMYKQISNPIFLMVAGAVLLGTFMFVLMREYEMAKN